MDLRTAYRSGFVSILEPFKKTANCWGAHVKLWTALNYFALASWTMGKGEAEVRGMSS